MTYPFTTSVQWIKRVPNPSGSQFNGDLWTESAPVTITAVFGPGSSAEVQVGGDVVTTQPTLYGVDMSLPITATDRFMVGSEKFEVDGHPQRFQPNPWTGDQYGQVIPLREVTG